MKNFFYTILLVLIAVSVFAQTSVHRVLILNEGYFDYFTNEIITPVTVAAYYPETEIYEMLNEVSDARFASDIKISGDVYFVAADKFLLKYDLFTDELLASIEVQGIRKIAVDENYIVVTRGEYLVSLDSYIQVYDRNTLEFVFEIPSDELNYTTEGVLIHEGIAYVAVNNGFNFGSEVGMIAQVDLAAQQMIETIDLGPEAINPDNIMFDGETIFTLNNKDYTGSSVSAYKLGTTELSTQNLLNISAGCGTSVYFNGNIYYQELFGTSVTKYEPFTSDIIGVKEFETSFYALAFDEIHDLLYTSETDYFSYGKIHVYDLSGNELKNFDAGVSPGNFVFDVRTATGILDVQNFEINIYPNPTSDFMNIKAEDYMQAFRISDIHGKIIIEVTDIAAKELQLDLQGYAPGNYFVTIATGESITTQLISKL
ncbi:MAG: T9SS type A sorting domain-containing protein [Chitinophagales bacterium]